jgi:hypothetical protein
MGFAWQAWTIRFQSRVHRGAARAERQTNLGLSTSAADLGRSGRETSRVAAQSAELHGSPPRRYHSLLEYFSPRTLGARETGTNPHERPLLFMTPAPRLGRRRALRAIQTPTTPLSRE